MRGVDMGSGDQTGPSARASRDGLIIETSANRDQMVKVLAPPTTPVETFPKGFDILMDGARDVLARHATAAE